MSYISYSDLPKFYKKFVEARSQDYIKFVHWFLAILNQHGIEGKEILSLACGSCLAETILASRGFQIIGIDLSEGMLIEAKKNIQNNSIKLIRGDMSNIPIKKNFNAVIAHYFSLNYLTDISHLQRCLKQVYEALRKGGIFFFDIIHATHYHDNKELDSENVIFYENPGLISVIKQKKKINNVVEDQYFNFFLDEGTNQYTLVRENHLIRRHTREEMLNALMKVGFDENKIKIMKYLEMSIPDSNDNRIAFIAEK